VSHRVGIVGGGPAGLATAIEARLAGLNASIFDRRQPPIDKPCGEGVMPIGVVHLTQLLGGPLAPSSCHPFSGIRWHNESGHVAQAEFSSGHGLGIRRSVLHAALTNRAIELGVEMHWGTTVRSICREGVHTDEGLHEVDWIVGADGLHSKVRRWAGIGAKRGKHERFGVRQHIGLAPESDFVEVHWSNGCEAYITPISNAEVGVAFLGSRGNASFDERLHQFPGLRARYEGRPRTSNEVGAGPFHQIVKRPVRGHVLLVGDASGYVDALTGEGLALAWRQAKAAITAIRTAQPQQYAAAHRAITRRYRFTTQWMLAMQRRPDLRRRVIEALASEPQAFETFLGFNEGHIPTRQLIPALARTLRHALIPRVHPASKKTSPLLPSSS
jgi:flavin-dependent dehydrogenase